uniref:Putative calpain-like cysteine protease A n=1 Tax=Lygus hesperus TaxID=30085 RepID=A0A0A9YK49_LYGHE
MELVPVNSLQLKTDDEVENQDNEVNLTEKEKRRLDILLQEETPGLHVDPTILHRLNNIDRELNVLRGERLKESGNKRNSSAEDEDALEICEDGWDETQNRLDKIEKTLAQMQQERTTNQRQRLLPLREAKSRPNYCAEVNAIPEESPAENAQ